MVDYVLHQERRLIVPKNPSDYIVIPKTRLLIGREQSHGNLDFNQMNRTLSDEGHFMPSPSIFMPYRNQVLKASNSDITLYDGKGRRISRKDAQQLAHKLTKDCWTYLYAVFAYDTKGEMQVTYNRIKGKDSIEEVTEELRLPKGIKYGDLVDLAFSRQGMPVRKSIVQEFDPNKNVFFYNPPGGSVARLGANAGRALLDCYGDPQDSVAALGVFACAAGAQKF